MESRLLRRITLPLVLATGLLAAGCGEKTQNEVVMAKATHNTCTGTYPSYWQDPAAKFAPQWAGQ